MSTPRAPFRTRKPGLSRAGVLVRGQIRDATAGRGFAESKLLTEWPEIAGQDVADIARPVKVTHPRGGLGATLVLLTTGAQAPMLEMQKEQLRAKVNAVYGYNAIARIQITQTAPTGFAEGQVEFTPARNKSNAQAAPTKMQKAEAAKQTDGVSDTALRDALAMLGANIKSKSNKPEK